MSLSHIHPMLVHFPIALVLAGFVADLASLFFRKEACLSKTGFYLLIAGTLSVLFALFSGVFFTAEMSGTAGEVKEIHETLAFVTLGLLIIASVSRIWVMIKQKEGSVMKWIPFIFYALAAISVGITGFYGGSLVYNYMMPL